MGGDISGQLAGDHAAETGERGLAEHSSAERAQRALLSTLAECSELLALVRQRGASGEAMAMLDALVARERAKVLRAHQRAVVFTLPRSGWVSFAFEGEGSHTCACNLAGARLAHAALSLPAGSGIVLCGNPNAARNARESFATFVESKGEAGRALAQVVRCIEVSSAKRTARFNPRPGVVRVLTR